MSNQLDAPQIIGAISWLDTLTPVGGPPPSNLEQITAYNLLDRSAYMAGKFVEKYMDVTQTLVYITELYRVNIQNKNLFSSEIDKMSSTARDIKTNTQKTRMRYMFKRGDALYNQLVTSLIQAGLFLVSAALVVYILFKPISPILGYVTIGVFGAVFIWYLISQLGTWYARDKFNPSRIVIRAAKPKSDS